VLDGHDGCTMYAALSTLQPVFLLAFSLLFPVAHGPVNCVGVMWRSPALFAHKDPTGPCGHMAAGRRLPVVTAPRTDNGCGSPGECLIMSERSPRLSVAVRRQASDGMLSCGRAVGERAEMQAPCNYASPHADPLLWLSRCQEIYLDWNDGYEKQWKSNSKTHILWFLVACSLASPRTSAGKKFERPDGLLREISTLDCGPAT
jgi:hypothetical protein